MRSPKTQLARLHRSEGARCTKPIRTSGRCIRTLPEEIRQAADKQFALLEVNPKQGSVQFKKIGVRSGKEIWSARVTLKYRAVAYKRDGGAYTWFWIGEHNAYDLLGR